MSVVQKVVSFCRQASAKQIGELPQFAREHFDTANWRKNSETYFREYKKRLLDKGDISPFLHVVGGLFIFNYIYSLPKEMAHVQHEQDARFGIHR